MLVPGFSVRELPLVLNNLNNVQYRHDGKLVALGYDGRIHLLSDTDKDGLEDTATPFWDPATLTSTIGMALTAKNDPRGEGVFVAGKGRISLFLDKDRDGRADEEITVASGWEKLKHQMDAVGLDIAPDGSIYFGLGCADYANAYQIDKATGGSWYNLASERGTIQKVSPDFKKRETVCTGIRWPVSLRFNKAGDLFCADQEGATWMPNGNPLDELLLIQPARHYGFPPRHPKHLPNVFDEPSVFDYGPQHQSTCGMNFNDSVLGGPVFGPAWWSGDVLVAGESRGKIYRTKLVNTAAGYVAQNQLIACLELLAMDVCVSPTGDLIVVTHGGKPDWGSGPQGKGRIFKISYTKKETPNPSLVWSASATEMRIAFDQPLDSALFKNLAKQTTITAGKYAAAGDRFETMRPGYAIVKAQQQAPRENVPVLSANISADRRTLLLRTPPLSAAVNYAITLPDFSAPSTRVREMPQEPSIDLIGDLHGVHTQWRDTAATINWTGWLPHIDLSVARALSVSSAEQEQLWPLLSQPGVLKFSGQLDLRSMLRPSIQPGAKLDYEPVEEAVTIHFSSPAPFIVVGEGQTLKSVRTGALESISVIPKKPGSLWYQYDIELTTGRGADPIFNMTWHTSEDKRPRAFPLRRFMLPWASLDTGAKFLAKRQPPAEIAGGNWASGKVLFNGLASCGKCHQVRGEGGKLGPDLSNLIERDYESVLKDIREPSAAINPDFVASNIKLTDGSVMSGIVLDETPESITVAESTAEKKTILRKNIKSITPSTASAMPEELVKSMNQEQLKDLMTYLFTEQPK